MKLYFSIALPTYFTIFAIYWTIVKADKETLQKIKLIKGLKLLNSSFLFGYLIFYATQIIMKAYWIDKPSLFFKITALQVFVCSLLLRFWEHNVKKERERKT